MHLYDNNILCVPGLKSDTSLCITSQETILSYFSQCGSEYNLVKACGILFLLSGVHPKKYAHGSRFPVVW